MANEAVMSECGMYRFVLRRDVNMFGRGNAVFVMLNPSTADAVQDDPTIRRCLGFARREGCRTLSVVNLSPFRSPHPNEAAAHEVPESVTEVNLRYIEDECKDAEVVIAAYGSHSLSTKLVNDHVSSALHGAKCLGVTKDGSPRHPLYVKSDAPLFNLAGA